jgi:hypothetical protein
MSGTPGGEVLMLTRKNKTKEFLKNVFLGIPYLGKLFFFNGYN